jgi:hypothetical protein
MPKKMHSTGIGNNIDIQKVNELKNRVDGNSKLIDEVVNQLVADYCKILDDYVKDVDEVLMSSEKPPTDESLENFCLNIPVILYFTGEAQETLGIREDVAKAIRQEVYNAVHQSAEGTVADKAAKAEIASNSEFIVWTAYQRAYKKVKLRAEAANELLQSVKKVMSRRISEKELSKIDSGRFQQ